MKLQKEKIIKISIMVTILIVALVLIFVLQKTGIVEIARNKIIEYRRAEVESDLQAIIDETKAGVQASESRDATLTDLKTKLAEQGYTLDETTGEVKYNGYYVTINGDLTIASIEAIVTNAYYEIKSIDEDNLNILLIIENGKGIERITGSDITIDCNGRETVAIDRTLLDGQEYQVKIKLVGEEKEELHTLVASKKPNIVVTNTDTLGDGTTQTIEIEYPDNENFINYYSLDDGETWQEYTGELNLLTTDNKTIAAKIVCKEGKTIENTEEKISLVVSDSLLSATEKAIMKNDTHYRIAVKDEEYTVHTYIENESLTLESNTTYGNAEDVATETEYAKYMVLVKVNGDLTINEGVTLTAYGTQYGGPKGMLLYTTGTLTNNGTITMTARGAKAEGQNVYLWKNQDTTNAEYEYVLAVGGSGGASATSNSNGKNGVDGANRETGGGGSGASMMNTAASTSGRGGNGTSYSGGTGGGASRNCTGLGGSDSGGRGGNAGIMYRSSGSGGGAGNPGGSNSIGDFVAKPGENGTGGLLILYGNSIENKGTINSDGMAGGYGYAAGGGASGGGSINIFYRNNIVRGTIHANGGIGGKSGGNYSGGSGGTGTVSIGNISSGTYVEETETEE